MNDWKKIFEEIAESWKSQKWGGYYNGLLLFSPATEIDLQRVKDRLGVTITGALLELLQQSNGICAMHGPYPENLVWNCDDIIAYREEHDRFCKDVGYVTPGEFIFFADNDSGDHFGYRVENGFISSEEVGIYYVLDNEFIIVAPDLKTWAIGWNTGVLKT